MLNPTTHSRAALPDGHPPVMMVVVDTEEEFDWGQPFSRQSVGVASISAQPALHDEVYDSFGMVPTYAVDWPVASTPSAIGTLSGLLEAGRCQIGTHLHPWVNPPHGEQVCANNSFPGNLPPMLEREKLKQLTAQIEHSFGIKPTLYKAGRYGVGPHTTQTLLELGYTVDASVVPHTSFSGVGGPDFTGLPEHPYWFGSTTRSLLELPVTTGFTGTLRQLGPALYPKLHSEVGKALHLPGVVARLGLLERIRLTPEGYTTQELTRLLRALMTVGQQVVTVTYHSSTLVPGNTTYVKNAQELRQFKQTVKDVLQFFQHELGGCFLTASELHRLLLDQRTAGAA
ncbi:polysaccharide deacetylase family protein [Rhodoferax sp. U11-2br]|uniref:polysaccharide deacetylase family protein n=1 Tax=Rhodoferax sp. U11-2br TaxID=2838878 RepID=UPI001BE99E8E|nr:polysaccharide deacetylase family protein [Rhodoferax sp. U11-2br]MBT3067050.1 polysaccharide deacetylase family protein [Rhodoferax sp. U11-2br]